MADRDGLPVAALVHDASLRDEPALLDAVTAAAAIALENARLNVELRARLEELRGSRARIVEAGDSERRRLERNLHDGAQQRLVAIALQLRLLENRVRDDPAAAEMASAAGEELKRSLNELRELARGLHPAVLEHGLGAALDALATRSEIPTTVRCDVPGRLPEPVELAAYFVVAEALTNVAKYAHASEASVRAWRDGELAVVEVVRRRGRRRRRHQGLGAARPRRPRRGARRPPARGQPGGSGDGRDRGAAVRAVIADDNLLVRAGHHGAAARGGDRGGRRGGVRRRAARGGRRPRARRGDRGHPHAADAHRRGAARGERDPPRAVRTSGS